MSEPAAGARVDDRYELLAPLPDQGIGDSWRAADHQLRGRAVALKFLPAEPPVATRRGRESLRHANVLAALRHGTWGGRAYAVHDLFEGPSLAAGLARARATGKALPLPLLLEFFDAACLGVAAAHDAAEPVVHGALAATSVLIQRLRGKSFDVRVADFGLGPDAPGRTVGDDVRALGAMLDAMTAGRVDVPRALRDVAARATDPRPEERFRAVALLREAAQRASEAPVERASLGVPAATALRPRPPADTVFAPNPAPAEPAPDTVFAPNPAAAEAAPDTLFEANPAAAEAAPDTLFVANLPPDENPWEVEGEAPHVTAAAPASRPPPRPHTSVENPWDTAVLAREIPALQGDPPRGRGAVIVATALAVAAACLALAGAAWWLLARR